MVAGGRDVSSSVYPDPLALQAAVEAQTRLIESWSLARFYGGRGSCEWNPSPECQTSGRLRRHTSRTPMAFFKFRWPGQGASGRKIGETLPLSASGKHRGHAAPRTASPDGGCGGIGFVGRCGVPHVVRHSAAPHPRGRAYRNSWIATRLHHWWCLQMLAMQMRPSPSLLVLIVQGQQSRTGTERLAASSTLADGEELVSSSSSGSNRAAVKPNPGSTAGAAASAGTKAPETKTLQPTRPRR